MVTRKKHLINVHTSTGTTAPTAADLRLGEIAVQHTSENPALWIKMGNTESSAVYEKFIGSTEITNMLEDNKILGSGYTYSGIPYVNSSTTLADAYSALTREMIDDEKVVAAALNDLNGRVIEISGNTPDMTNYYDKGEVEHIISVSGGTDVSPLSGAVMSLSAGTIALVGSSAASVFSSAKTYTDSKIGKLDSTGHTSDSGHYLTSVTITDGIITAVGEKPVPGETDITTATSGNGNVISNLTVTGHQITMVKGVTAATSAQVSTLSAATHAHIANGNIHVTGAQKTAWTNGANSGASAYTGVTQLSGAVGSLEDEVAKIAVTAVTVSGTGNAVVAATYSDSALTLGKGNVQAVISDLATIRSNAASGMQAYNDVRSLSAATTGISQTLNTVSGAAHNKITALSAATTGMGQGLSNLSAATLSAVTAKGDNYIDASVASRSAITVTTKKPVVTDLSAAISGTGSLADAKAIKTYIDNTLSSTVTYKGATASLPSNPAAGDMWVAASAFTAGRQSVEVGDFVIARTSGTSAQWDVIEKNLDGAVTGSLTADTVTLGESTNSVKSLANGTEGQVLVISSNSPAWADAQLTDTATTKDGHYNPGFTGTTAGTAAANGFTKAVLLDGKGHVTGTTTGTAITAETKVSVTTNAAGNTASAVVSGIASGGTLGHTLTVSKTNKIFSASTSDSATTTKSATTAENSVSATTATSAKTSSSAVTTTSAVTSQSASTAADSAKLGGVAAANYSQTSHTHSQYVNQNAFGKIAVGSTTGTATAVTDTLTFSGAGATTVSIDATNRKITISSTDNDTKVTAVGNHYTATTATKTGGTTTTTAASAVKGITYDNAGHIVGVTTGSVLTGETQLSTATTGTGNVVGNLTVSNHKITMNMFSAASADQIAKLSGATMAHTASTTMHVADNDRTRWNNAWTSGVSAYTKVEELSAGTLYELKQTSHNIPYVVQSGNTYTGSTYAYVAETSELTELVDGQSIIFHPKQNSTTGTTNGSASTCSLSIKLADGTTTTPRPIYLGKTAKITTHIQGCSDIKLTYHDNATYSGVTGLCGWWVDFYYADGNTPPYYLYYYGTVISSSPTGIQRYSLSLQKPDGTWASVTTNSASGASASIVNTTGFLPHSDILYYNTVLNAGAVGTASNGYSTIYSMDIRYSVNQATFTKGETLYLVGTIGNDGLFYLDTTKWWSTTLPTTEDGKVYIFLGTMYSTTSLTLWPEHPIYEFKNGHVRLYQEGGGALTGVSAGGTEVPVTGDVAVIPSASSSVFGVVKTGSFLSNSNGTISVATGTTSSTVARGDHAHDEYATTATLNALSAATDTHVGDGDIHVTAQQKGGWDAKQDAITDLAQIRNNALSGASAYTRVQELSASVIANRDAISALTDSLEELSGAVWSKEFVIAMGMNDLRDKIREISGSTGLPDVTTADDGKILRVQSGAWAMVDPTVIYTGSGTPASTLGNEGDIYFQI